MSSCNYESKENSPKMKKRPRDNMADCFGKKSLGPQKYLTDKNDLIRSPSPFKRRQSSQNNSRRAVEMDSLQGLHLRTLRDSTPQEDRTSNRGWLPSDKKSVQQFDPVHPKNSISFRGVGPIGGALGDSYYAQKHRLEDSQNKVSAVNFMDSNYSNTEDQLQRSGFNKKKPNRIQNIERPPINPISTTSNMVQDSKKSHAGDNLKKSSLDFDNIRLSRKKSSGIRNHEKDESFTEIKK